MVDNRPSKKQRELLQFIDGFIKGYGYGPSYREIMRALGYKSVSTVAVHVDGLIARGYLQKTDNSARSIEIVSHPTVPAIDIDHKKWLKAKIETRLETATDEEREALERASVLLDIELSGK